jgi:hypothetical protein
MIEAEWSEAANRAPALEDSSPVVLYVYVENVDETLARWLMAREYSSLRRISLGGIGSRGSSIPPDMSGRLRHLLT